MSEENNNGASVDWNEKLQKDDIYIISQKAGISVDDFKASSEDELKSALDELKKKLKDLPESGLEALSDAEKEKVNNIKSGEKENPAKNDNAKNKAKEKQAAGEEKNGQDNGKATKKEIQPRDSFEVNGERDDTPQENLQWIEEKRKFWKEFAQNQENTFQNDPQKDVESKSFTCTLSKEQDAGTITYSSPTSARITKESHLTMYQGLVKDALNNNLSITFGASLDDKQKALLLAACLMEKGKYNNGEDLQMVNPPKIDMSAEYIKTLPEETQKILADYAIKQQSQETQQQIDSKIADVRAKLKKNQQDFDKEGANKEALSKEREMLRSEQFAAMKEAVKRNPASHISGDNKETVEKIKAARLGLINDPTITDANGKQIVKDGNYQTHLQTNRPEVLKYLQDKYGKGPQGK